MQKRGYTLIELLAVVVLLGLIAATGIPSIVRMAAGNPLDRAFRALRDGEHQLRQAARGRAIAIAVTLQADGLQCEQIIDEHHHSNDDALTIRLEPIISVAWTSLDQKPLTKCTFDRNGRTLDRLVIISMENNRRRYQVSGISGEWFELLTPATDSPQMTLSTTP